MAVYVIPRDGVRYFILGFLRRNVPSGGITPLVGYYIDSSFYIDYSGAVTGKVSKSFLTDKREMDIVTLGGMERRYYSEIKGKGYVRSKIFVADELDFLYLDEQEDGVLSIESGGFLRLPLSRLDGRVWERNGSRSNMCEIWFSTDEFLWDTVLNIEIFIK